MTTTNDKTYTFDEVGTVIGSHWGQYTTDRLIVIAASLGFDGRWENDAELIDAADRRVSELHRLDEATLPENYFELSIELANEAMEWLNNNHVAPGLFMDWFEGVYVGRFCDADDERDCIDDECWHVLNY